MNNYLAIPGFEGQLLEVKPAGFFSGAKLIVNEQPAAKGPKRGQMLLRSNDGRDVVASWKWNFFDVPKLMVDGTTYSAAEPLKWYQWIWGGLPVLLIFVGGAIGGLFGLLGFTVNAKIFRSNMNGFMKYATIAVVNVSVVLVYVVLAAFLVAVINGSSA